MYAHETTLGDKKYAHYRFKLVAQRHLEQKVKDSLFRARNRDEDRRAPRKEKAKGKGKTTAKNNSERGDCIRWITEGQCSFGEACAFKHDPNKKSKREDLVHLLRHVYRTETRKVTEKVAMTQVLKTDRKIVVKVRQEKRTYCLVQTSRKEVAKIDIHFLACSRMCKNSKLQVDANSETSVPSNTQQNMLTIRQLSAPSAIHIPSKDARQAQSQYREGLHHLANKYVLKRENGTRTWSLEPAKSKRSNLRRKIYPMDVEHGRNGKKTAWIFTQERAQSSKFIF